MSFIWSLSYCYEKNSVWVQIFSSQCIEGRRQTAVLLFQYRHMHEHYVLVFSFLFPFPFLPFLLFILEKTHRWSCLFVTAIGLMKDGNALNYTLNVVDIYLACLCHWLWSCWLNTAGHNSNWLIAGWLYCTTSIYLWYHRASNTRRGRWHGCCICSRNSYRTRGLWLNRLRG